MYFARSQSFHPNARCCMCVREREQERKTGGRKHVGRKGRVEEGKDAREEGGEGEARKKRGSRKRAKGRARGREGEREGEGLIKGGREGGTDGGW